MEIPYNLSLDESEVSKCLLCLDPLCTKACPQHRPAGDILRSIYLKNYIGASKKLGPADCTYCNAPCEKACVLSLGKEPVSMREIFMELSKEREKLPDVKLRDVDLSTEICGVPLENPFLLSSSVVASTYDMCRRAFETGWAGAAFKTICNFDQHEASPRFSAIRNHSWAMAGFKNIEQLSDHSVEENMMIFRKLREEFPSKAIIASIMGRNEDEWSDLAEKCEKAGASVIECNFSCLVGAVAPAAKAVVRVKEES